MRPRPFERQKVQSVAGFQRTGIPVGPSLWAIAAVYGRFFDNSYLAASKSVVLYLRGWRSQLIRR